MIPAAGSGVEKDPLSLPEGLRWEILATLEDLPALATQEGRRILVVSAELGTGLEDRLEEAEELESFCELLLEELTRLRRLPDGRHPLEEILKAARKLAGPRDREDYDLLLRQVRAWIEGAPIPRVPEEGRRHSRNADPGGSDWWTSSDEILRCVKEKELARIRENVASVPQSDRPHVWLLFGGWGVGKTAFLKLVATSSANGRKLSLISRLKGRARRKTVLVPQDRGLAEPLILRIFRAFEEEDRRKFLTTFRKGLRQHQERLRSIIEAKTPEDPDTGLRDDLLKLVESGGLMLLDPFLGQGTATSTFVAEFLRVSPQILQKSWAWLKGLSREDLGPLSEIRRSLASSLARDLARMSRKHEALLLGIDDYDACSPACSRDLLDLVRHAGSRVFWVFAGRFEHSLNSPFKLLKDSLHAHFNEIHLLPLTEKEILDLLERIQHRTVHRARTATELKWYASQIWKVTDGRFPLVETALRLWQRGFDLETDILQLLLQRLNRDLDARYTRFLYAFVLLGLESREDRSQILRSLDTSQDLRSLVRDLVAHFPVVSESSTELLDIHPAWAERLKEYLMKDAVRLEAEILEIHDRACRYLTKKRAEQDSRLRTLSERLRDERWQEIELPRIHHHFHLDIDQGWLELAPTVLGAWAIGQKDFLEQILGMLQRLRPILEGANARKLERFESGLAGQACTRDRIELLDELERLCVEVVQEASGAGPEDVERRQMIGRLRSELESQLWAELAWMAHFTVAETPVSPEEEEASFAPTPDSAGPERSLSPGDAEGLGRDDSATLRIGTALFLKGCYEIAAQAYREALEIDEGSVGARLGLGDCYTRLGRLEEAAAEYLGAAAQSVDARARLGALYLELGSWNEAKEMYLWALRSDPKDPGFLRGAAESFAGLGLHREAFEYFREAHAAGVSDPSFLRGFLFSYRKGREPEIEPGEDDLALEPLKVCLAEAEALVRSETCDLYDRSCLAALLGLDGLALHLLRHAMSRNNGSRERALADPHLETLRSLPEFEELVSSVAEDREPVPLRRRPIYVIFGCRSVAARLVADPGTGLGLLCREPARAPRATRSCWLSVITAGPEARQIIPLTPVERFPLDSLEGVACSGDQTLGRAFDLLSREMGRELWFPEGDDGAWVILLLDSEPADSWRWALDELREARAGAIEKIVALGMNGINSETLRSLAPFPPHERHLMPDPTPERLEAFFRGLAERCLDPNGKGGR